MIFATAKMHAMVPERLDAYLQAPTPDIAYTGPLANISSAMQKSFKILFLLIVLITGCENNSDNKTGYFIDINPDKILHRNESFMIDG